MSGDDYRAGQEDGYRQGVQRWRDAHPDDAPTMPCPDCGEAVAVGGFSAQALRAVWRESERRWVLDYSRHILFACPCGAQWAWEIE